MGCQDGKSRQPHLPRGRSELTRGPGTPDPSVRQLIELFLLMNGEFHTSQNSRGGIGCDHVKLN
jgi:hypothetical protein